METSNQEEKQSKKSDKVEKNKRKYNSKFIY